MEPAVLALENGEIFQGVAIGAQGQAVGEVVFNTAMTGYQEILTDPSYAQQIVTLTYPHIGNTGTNSEDFESTRAHAVGLVIRDLPLLESSWRAEQSLPDFLKAQNVVAISGIDTRMLTRILREHGAQRGCIMTGTVDEQAALKAAKAFPGLENMDLAKEVTTEKSYIWTQGIWNVDPAVKPRDDGLSAPRDDGLSAPRDDGLSAPRDDNAGLKVVAYDFGVKHNILRMLAERGCDVTVVPAQTPADEVLAMKPDGVFLSNGPGDPAPCDYAIEAIKVFLENDVPLFGICLGHQLLALALGARTVKMKLGHHGANHPVKDLRTEQVMITSQNHGFMVDEETLPEVIEVTHRSLFDNSIQGIAHKTKKAFSFQGHPEASPGPHDVAGLFDEFVEMIGVEPVK